MYVNINRYLKIYFSNPPYTYIGPRANTWEMTKDKNDNFLLAIVNEGKKPLRYFMIFTIFSTFLCYRRKFSVKPSTGREIRGGFFMPERCHRQKNLPLFAEKIIINFP